MNETKPIEISYEQAKMEIITFIGAIAQKYDIPMVLLNSLIYEIALEARQQSYSMILSNIEAFSKQKTEVPVKIQEDTANKTPKQVTISKEELEKHNKTVASPQPKEASPSRQ